MTQHGATEEETINEFRKQVTDAWKDINEECLLPTTVSMPILMRILNLSRVSEIVYKDEDCNVQNSPKQNKRNNNNNNNKTRNI
jgi:hypothetical protein